MNSVASSQSRGKARRNNAVSRVVAGKWRIFSTAGNAGGPGVFR